MEHRQKKSSATLAKISGPDVSKCPEVIKLYLFHLTRRPTMYLNNHESKPVCALENEKKNLEHAFLLEPGERPARHLTGTELCFLLLTRVSVGKYPDPLPKLETVGRGHTAAAYSGITSTHR